ncbi:MAG TPA: DUF167 domain-containing protein [Candidatus Nanoarchaeia archaeon]|nr:DUF167 domain-containing protein [Candidatus Nanoarchaeia archaeon]
MAKIEVNVRFGKKNKILSVEGNKYYVMLDAKPIEGEANKELIKFLKKELKEQFILVSGFKSRRKLLDIL